MPRRPPDGRLEYAQLWRAYRARWAAWRAHVLDVLEDEFTGQRHDAVDEDALDRAFSELFSAAGLSPALTRSARGATAKSRSFVAKQTERPVGWSAREQAAVETFRNENLSLVSAVGRDQRVRLARLFRPAQAAGMRWESLVPSIKETLQIGENRARLIARDQTAKLNSQLAEAHQQSAGVTEYIWRTSKDRAVRGNPSGLYPPGPGRDNHFALEGTRQRWDSPPVTNPTTGDRNHPGRGIQCRCTAEPVIPELPRAEPAQAKGRRGRASKPQAEHKLGAPLRVDPQGMREESLAYLRQGGAAVDSLPVTIAYYPGEVEARIVDGRHRITVARERGERFVTGRVIWYDRKLNIKRRQEGVRIPV